MSPVPRLSTTGTRGIFTMPASIASINARSDATHGNDVADPGVDELITLAQQIVAHAAHGGTPYAHVPQS